MAQTLLVGMKRDESPLIQSLHFYQIVFNEITGFYFISTVHCDPGCTFIEIFSSWKIKILENYFEK